MLPTGAEVAPERILLLRGTVALAENRPAVAVADLRQVVDLQPESWEHRALFARALARNGDRPEAYAQARYLPILAPVTLRSWQALGQLAREMKDTGLELQAAAGQQRFFPDDPLLQQRLATLYRQNKLPTIAARYENEWQRSLPPLRFETRPHATVTELQAQAGADPPDVTALSALAGLDWQEGRQDAARDRLQRIVQLTPKNPTAIGNFVHACLQTGKIEEALEALTKAAPLGDYSLDRALALWSTATGRYAPAVEALVRLRERTPMETSVNLHLGAAALAAGELATAINTLRIAWLTSHSHLAAQHYAAALFASGQQPEAIELLKTAGALWPKEILLQRQLAAYYHDSGRVTEAAQQLVDMAKENEGAVELLLTAGERYLRAGYVGRASALAARLRDSYPNNVLAIRGAAQLYRKLNMLAEARLLFTRYLGPQFKSTVPRADILVEMARNAIETHQLPEAVTALSELRKTYPAHRTALELLGLLYVQQERWAEAVTLYRQAVKYYPRDAEFLLALARAARRQGDMPLAVQTYEQALGFDWTPAPCLELGDLYQQLGNEVRAREVWRAAQNRPQGALRAQYRLLQSYEAKREPPPAVLSWEGLAKQAETERTACHARWGKALAGMGLTATEEELTALLLLNPALLDPAALEREAPAKPPGATAPG